MKQFELLRTQELFPGSKIVRKFSFKAVHTRGKCVQMAVLKHPGCMGEQFAKRTTSHLAMTLVNPRGQSAHFWKNDCFECLSPHIKVH